MPPEDPRWRLRVRLPHRVSPIDRTTAEVAGQAALVGAAFALALAAVLGRSWSAFLLFPAFGIPDLLFVWFRRRRLRLPGRWSTDLRAALLLAVLTVYLGVSAAVKLDRLVPLIGVGLAVVLAAFADVVWFAQVVRDRPR